MKGKKGLHKDIVIDIVNKVRDAELDLSSLDLPSIIISVIQPSKAKGYKNRLAFCPTMAFTVVEMIFGLEFLE